MCVLGILFGNTSVSGIFKKPLIFFSTRYSIGIIARKFKKVQAKKLVKSNKSFFSRNCTFWKYYLTNSQHGGDLWGWILFQPGVRDFSVRPIYTIVVVLDFPVASEIMCIQCNQESVIFRAPKKRKTKHFRIWK